MLYFENYKINLDINSLVPIDLCIKYSILIIDLIDDNLLVFTTEENIIVEDLLNIYFSRKLDIRYTSQELIQIKIKEIEELRNNNKFFKETEELNDDIVVNYLNEMLNQAIILNATDIHIEPFQKNTNIRYRINGKLENMDNIENMLFKFLGNRIKLLSGLNISENRLPQDGKINMELNNKSIDIRVSTLPKNYGEKFVLRILDKTKFDFDIKHLGLEEDILEKLIKLINQPYGLILFTGPAGSGKTTTMYSILNKLNDNSKNIITLEDPIEYTIEGINQSQINQSIGYTFDVGFKGILRQDPEIIMIGEIRDNIVADMALRAGITGHLIFSTLHTNDAITSILRLRSMGIKNYLINSGVIGIISQRLVAILCDKCKEIDYDNDLSKKGNVKIYKAVGCDYCRGGYINRKLLMEIINFNSKLKETLQNTPDIYKLKDELYLNSIEKQAKKLLLNGEIDVKEYLRVSIVI